MTPFLVVAGAYLIGAIPFSYISVWLLRGRDIREVGSGNAGATNVLRSVGPAAAVAVLAFDILKGAAPVMAARYLGVPAQAVAGAALAAVVGHVFPLYIGFRGGKGVATALGALAALSFVPTAVGAAAMLLLIAWRRYVSLGSIVGMVMVPGLMLFFQAPPVDAAVAAAIALLVVVKHSGNIRRLLAGTERRLGDQVEVAP